MLEYLALVLFARLSSWLAYFSRPAYKLKRAVYTHVSRHPDTSGWRTRPAYLCSQGDRARVHYGRGERQESDDGGEDGCGGMHIEVGGQESRRSRARKVKEMRVGVVFAIVRPPASHLYPCQALRAASEAHVVRLDSTTAGFYRPAEHTFDLSDLPKAREEEMEEQQLIERGLR